MKTPYVHSKTKNRDYGKMLSPMPVPQRRSLKPSSFAGTLVVALLLLVQVGCKKITEDVTPNTNPSAALPVTEANSLQPEQAFPGQAGIVKQGHLYGAPIEYAEINGQAVFQGDIILTPEQLSQTAELSNGRTEGTGRTKMSTRWPYNIVYYTLASGLPSTSLSRAIGAMAYWQANSTARIRFVYRTTQSNYVTFRPGDGCSSLVGMQGGQQFINISTACTTGNIIHEIDHTLGVWHEQSRADRDQNVTIHWANIIPGYENNFKTYVERGLDGFDYGPFDFGSIMMYLPYAFSKNGQPTITRKDGSLYTTQRNELSTGDKATAKVMYLSKDALYSGTKCYFFSGNHFIRVTRGDTGPGTVDMGYPQSIANWGWGSFDRNGIDAALYSGSKCYFFSGNKYIRVTRGDTGPGTVDAGYPQSIANWGWGSFGQKGIDAALYSGSKCYFFSGDQYIRVTRGDTGPGTVDAGYPKPISTWNWGSFGQRGIDAALYSGSKCYFFSGDQYIRVTRGDIAPGTVDAGYPKHISTWDWPSSFRW